jgi:hypothetical protein
LAGGPDFTDITADWLPQASMFEAWAFLQPGSRDLSYSQFCLVLFIDDNFNDGLRHGLYSYTAFRIRTTLVPLAALRWVFCNSLIVPSICVAR